MLTVFPRIYSTDGIVTSDRFVLTRLKTHNYNKIALLSGRISFRRQSPADAGKTGTIGNASFHNTDSFGKRHDFSPKGGIS
jgi:hypothetical protein